MYLFDCKYGSDFLVVVNRATDPKKNWRNIDAVTINRQGGQIHHQMLHLCSADATSVALLDFSAVQVQHLESWFAYSTDAKTTYALRNCICYVHRCHNWCQCRYCICCVHRCHNWCQCRYCICTAGKSSSSIVDATSTGHRWNWWHCRSYIWYSSKSYICWYSWFLHLISGQMSQSRFKSSLLYRFCICNYS